MRTVFNMILLTLVLNSVTPKLIHRYLAPEDSIENVLYFKDCRRSNNTQTTTTTTTTPSPPHRFLHQNTCPCPKLCCSPCCGDCNTGGSIVMSMGNQNVQLKSDQPPAQRSRPILPPQMMRSKKIPPFMPPNVKTRRDMSSTREHIKGLLARDEDIKRILKNLVRVTIQKVDLLEKLKERKEAESVNSGDEGDE